MFLFLSFLSVRSLWVVTKRILIDRVLPRRKGNISGSEAGSARKHIGYRMLVLFVAVLLLRCAVSARIVSSRGAARWLMHLV